MCECVYCVGGRWFTWVVGVGTIKDLKAPFPVLKAGHVDHLLVHIIMYLLFYDVIGVCFI